ncbi:MAG: hypothetical protein AAB394_02540 [Patescibacteria group bacterium]
MNAEEFEKLKEETIVLARESLIFRYNPANLAEFERAIRLKDDPEVDKDIVIFSLNTFKELEELIDEGIKFWVKVETLTELKEAGLA